MISRVVRITTIMTMTPIPILSRHIFLFFALTTCVLCSQIANSFLKIVRNLVHMDFSMIKAALILNYQRPGSFKSLTLLFTNST